ncbi:MULTISPECIES: winged helix-turn-helix transcriptional regulator [Deferrisoma]
MGAIEAFETVLKCKWTLRILALLAEAPKRPAELFRGLPGISWKVLYERLARLVDFGFVEKTVVSEKPSHVEYALTPKGRRAAEIVEMVKALDDL